jgi:hypothetical protein
VGAQDFLLLLLVRSISRLFHHASLPLTQLTDALNLLILSEGKNSRIHPNRLWRSPTVLATEFQEIRVRRESTNEHAKRGEVDLFESHVSM